MKTNSYTRTEIKDGKLQTIKVVEEIHECFIEKPISGRIGIVKFTGPYGHIRFQYGDVLLESRNPFQKNMRGAIMDNREEEVFVATNVMRPSDGYEYPVIALDITDLAFNLEPNVMAELHSKIFMAHGTGQRWEVVPENFKI